VSLIMTLVTGRMEFIFAGHRVVVEPGDELLYPAHTVHAASNIHDGTTQMMESYR
jgi:quercetin dioxygenase-like cupin family protein